MEPEQQSKPRTRLGKSGKDIAAKQARIEKRRQSDAALRRHMQQLAAPASSAAHSAGISAKPPQQSAKTHALAPNKATRFVIASPRNKATKMPILPIQDLARALANNAPAEPTRKRGRFDSTLNRGRMLADLLDDIP